MEEMSDPSKRRPSSVHLRVKKEKIQG